MYKTGGLGLEIRNGWGLWKGSRLYHFFNTKGIFHPDDMSVIIRTSYYRNLKGIEIDLDKQILNYQTYWKNIEDNQKKSPNSIKK